MYTLLLFRLSTPLCQQTLKKTPHVTPKEEKQTRNNLKAEEGHTMPCRTKAQKFRSETDIAKAQTGKHKRCPLQLNKGLSQHHCPGKGDLLGQSPEQSCLVQANDVTHHPLPITDLRRTRILPWRSQDSYSLLLSF